MLAACAPKGDAAPPKLVAFPGTPTPQCVREEILPKITELQPDEINPGTQITVSATGGYFRDNCGGYDEGSRLYKIYVDDEPVADLSCYLNHCEGKFVVAENATVGAHCVGVQKGTCQTKFDVAAN